MSLDVRALVANGVALAFSLMPEGTTSQPGVKRSGVYRRRNGSGYDPETGTVTPSDTDVPLSFLIASYSQREVDGVTVKAGDEKLVVSALDLQAVGIVDSDVDDTVLETGGPERQVVSITTDPTKQVMVIQVRRMELALAQSSGASGQSGSGGAS